MTFLRVCSGAVAPDSARMPCRNIRHRALLPDCGRWGCAPISGETFAHGGSAAATSPLGGRPDDPSPPGRSGVRCQDGCAPMAGAGYAAAKLTACGSSQPDATPTTALAATPRGNQRAAPTPRPPARRPRSASAGAFRWAVTRWIVSRARAVDFDTTRRKIAHSMRGPRPRRLSRASRSSCGPGDDGLCRCCGGFFSRTGWCWLSRFFCLR